MSGWEERGEFNMIEFLHKVENCRIILRLYLVNTIST